MPGKSPTANQNVRASWSIAEVARMSGVSSRTLRHYGNIGLLAPAYIGDNCHRYYELVHLLRLQQILVLRELGVGLGEIAEVLDDGSDPIDALRRHHARLVAQRDRLSQLLGTVAATVAQLERSSEGGHPMNTPKINRPENLFAGFDGSVYEAEARERWPKEFEQSQRVAAGFSDADVEAGGREMTARMIRMAEFMVAGVPADDAAVLDAVDEEFRSVSRFWTPNAVAFTNLGQMYVDDERFRSNYEVIAEGLAEYQRDAMRAYAQARLS